MLLYEMLSHKPMNQLPLKFLQPQETQGHLLPIDSLFLYMCVS